MNNKYRLTVSHPLLRPDLVLETEASERYVVAVAHKMLELVRQINDPQSSVADPGREQGGGPKATPEYELP